MNGTLVQSFTIPEFRNSTVTPIGRDSDTSGTYSVTFP